MVVAAGGVQLLGVVVACDGREAGTELATAGGEWLEKLTASDAGPDE